MLARRPSGFTLLELLITLSVVTILTVIAYPNMRSFFQRNSVIAQSNSLQANLQYARGQAAATRGYVSICPLSPASSSSSSLNTTCNTDTKNYAFGWLVYTSNTPNSVYSATTSTLQSVSPGPSGMSVMADTAGVLTYNSMGELVINDNPASVNFITCADDPAGDAIGVSTTAVPGIQLSAADSGRIASTPLAADASCSP